MNLDDDKYDFPETLNQQERMIVLPIDKFIVTVPLVMTEVLCNMSMVLAIVAGLLRWLVYI
ncbi:type IV conjugative transfer system protein TraL [Enterobacter sp.]|uniref:type IV conjugative transfer system protein TraL n=1 Tax=Enterobacter sp. TaxID=42895 RepID=UPI00296E5B47|nr:type IV conjugative transfer system protein TraL [Enterobacter sp.]